jgi:hypothetical protein
MSAKIDSSSEASSPIVSIKNSRAYNIDKSGCGHGLKMQSFSNLLHLNNQQHSLHSHNKYHNHHIYNHHFHHGNVGPAFTTNVENCHEIPSKDPVLDTGNASLGTSPKVEYSSSPKNNFLHKNHNHHHHSIQELIRHFGKKVQHWRTDAGYRRSSCTEDGNKYEEDFRSRSKSLDAATGRRVLGDCEATYRIYDAILKEGRLRKGGGGSSPRTGSISILLTSKFNHNFVLCHGTAVQMTF